MTAAIPVAVIGTVGVPARYGGFETLAEQLALNTDAAVMRLTLYGQKSAYGAAEREGDINGHARVFLPLSANGVQSMAHDALALFDAAILKRHSALLVLGTSGAWALPLVRLLRPRLRVVTNIDGMEWRRDKFGRLAKALLRGLEWLAVKSSHAIIADNAALVPIVQRIHGIAPVLIAYGGDHTLVETPPKARSQGLAHWLAVARIEPENNSAMILDSVAAAGVPMVFVGNWQANAYGRALVARHDGDAETTLHAPVYDQASLAVLRAGAVGYIHGHSVGGTNPSLVEALFHTDRILAFDCAFNRATLVDAGAYFADGEALKVLLQTPGSGVIAPETLALLRGQYRWQAIADAYRRALIQR